MRVCLSVIGQAMSRDINRGFSLVPSEIKNFLPKTDAELSLLLCLHYFLTKLRFAYISLVRRSRY